MAWFLAPSLTEFRNEINEKYPDRDKSSDGSVGDTSHQARISSHNPLWSAPGKWAGVVRAIDIDNNGKPGEQTPLVKDVLKAAIGDPRVWYVIYNGKIYSRTYGWQPKKYTGSNPHDKHVHISLREDAKSWGDESKWFDNPKGSTPPQVDVSNVRQQFRLYLGLEDGKVVPLPGVRRIKRALREDYGFKLKDDGYVGARTIRAWKHHEYQVGRRGRAGVPDKETLRALSKGRFKVVD